MIQIRSRCTLWLCSSLFLLTGCVYRFTNTAISSPPGVRSIAIESVYDTSREVVPHEHLWESLQRAFAQNGRLKVVSRDQADALVRIHLVTANVNPTGSASEQGVAKDPQFDRDNILEPSQYRNLAIAGAYTKEESLAFTVVIEVWNLKSAEVIFSRAYSASDKFLSLRDDKISPTDTFYLAYEEALNSDFRRQARSIANKVVTDLFL